MIKLFYQINCKYMKNGCNAILRCDIEIINNHEN